MTDCAAYISSRFPGDKNNDRRVEVQRQIFRTWASDQNRKLRVFEDHGPSARFHEQINGDPTGLSGLTELVRASQVGTLLLGSLASIGRSIQVTAGFLRELHVHQVDVILLGIPDNEQDEAPIGVPVNLADVLPGLEAAGQIEAKLNLDRHLLLSRPNRRKVLLPDTQAPTPFDDLSMDELLANAQDAAWLSRRSARKLDCPRAEEHDRYLSADALSALRFVVPEEAELCSGANCLTLLGLREVEVLIGRVRGRLARSDGDRQTAARADQQT